VLDITSITVRAPFSGITTSGVEWHIAQEGREAVDVSRNLSYGMEVRFYANGKGLIAAIEGSCEGEGGTKVDIALYDASGAYRGLVRYQHLRSLAVSEGEWIHGGTILGYCHPEIPDVAGCYYNRYSAHTHVEARGGSWSWPAGMRGDYAAVTSNVTPIVTFG